MSYCERCHIFYCFMFIGQCVCVMCVVKGMGCVHFASVGARAVNSGGNDENFTTSASSLPFVYARVKGKCRRLSTETIKNLNENTLDLLQF